MSDRSLPSTIPDDRSEWFDRAWQGGQRPRIEDYLDTCPEDQRPALFDLLFGIETERRREAGERPEPADYDTRFPEYGTSIRNVLAGGRPVDETIEVQPAATAPYDGGMTPAPGLPQVGGRAGTLAGQRVGHYTLQEFLGRGNFVVYKARDDRGGLLVALKLARPDFPESRRRLTSLADEAGLLAALDHPRIVRFYEYIPPGGPGAGVDGCIALEYVEGRPGERTLEELLESGPVPASRLIRIAALVAEALHHAHTHAGHLTHRDLKPANILLDLDGEPRVCDFGLAIDEEIQRLRRGEVAGTPPYMAPEQVLGETHRLDGRTDLWALGVILYRGLTRRMPFEGPGHAQYFDEILHRDPRPPRMIDPGIDPELERIVLRCLSRPMADRYPTGADLADDLWRAIDEQRPGPAPDVPVEYRGLRSFDTRDARFFLALLPGPRRGDGMPESIRFWKARIESADGAFPVGVLYGPSGGGKSSFVKAGLLPNLDRAKVRAIEVEANAEGAEAGLLAAIRREFPSMPGDADLPLAIALMRDDPERRAPGKILLVLDQFEQALQARSIGPDSGLVRALQQCDGRRVAALLLVRDEFWMPLSRLMHAVGVPIAQGGNASAVELFDTAHARKVLDGFGRALGRIPEGDGPDSARAGRFLDEALQDLADGEGRVVPIRLSLFIEVVRSRPWTSETLRELGGVDGIGVKFLDDGFARPEYRHDRDAAQRVLGRLLPSPTSLIRGNPAGRGELLAASGLADRPGEFDDLLRALAHDLRLIMEADGPEPGEPRYRLAHDYLVRPVRQWIERDQDASPVGRARRRLALIAASWRERPGTHQLPSLLEWASILRNVPSRGWSPDERALMRAAARRFAAIAAMIVAASAIAAAGLLGMSHALRARDMLQLAASSEPETLRTLLPEISAWRGRLRGGLERLEHSPTANPRERANATLLLHRDRPTAARAAALHERLHDARPDEVLLIREALAANPPSSGGDRLLELLLDEAATDGDRLRAACTLAAMTPAECMAGWAKAGEALADGLLAEEARTHPRWLELLGPAADILVPALRAACGQPGNDPSWRSSAAEALAWVLSDRADPVGFAGAIAESQPDASLVLLRRLAPMPNNRDGLDYLRREADRPNGDDQAVRRSAISAVALAYLGNPEALEQAFRHREDPRLRTEAIQVIVALNLAPRLLRDRPIRGEADGPTRQAAWMAWAETSPDAVGTATRNSVLRRARREFLDDPDPGVHSAVELLIRRWDTAAPPGLPAGIRKRTAGGERGWEIGPNGLTLVYVRGPLEFVMGSPEGELPLKRWPYENLHGRRIDRSLLVASTETTVSQYRQFKPGHPTDPRYRGGDRDDPDQPAGGVSWYEAVRYCNWLSRKAGLDPFYPEDVKPGDPLPAGGRDLGGFRLPTEPEWEYLCRAGTRTCRPFGESDRYLNRYARTWLNSRELSGPVGRLLPNELGLFDMLGSQWEWCGDGSKGADYYPAYPAGARGAPDDFGPVPVNSSDWRVVRGGSFDSAPSMARSAHRDIFTAKNARYFSGFRVVRTETPGP